MTEEFEQINFDFQQSLGFLRLSVHDDEENPSEAETDSTDVEQIPFRC